MLAFADVSAKLRAALDAFVSACRPEAPAQDYLHKGERHNTIG